MRLEHKPIVFPEVDLSNDDADPEWNGSEFIEIPGRSVYRWVSPPGVAAAAWKVFQQEWVDIVTRYEADPDDFMNAWYYLDGHPAFWTFRQEFKCEEWPPNHLHRLEHQQGITRCIFITPHKVNPETLAIDEDESLNTLTQLWYELGKMDLLPGDHGGGVAVTSHWHDWQLDGGAGTYEAAIIDIARKVWESYGNDRIIVDTPRWESDDAASDCKAEEGESEESAVSS